MNLPQSRGAAKMEGMGGRVAHVACRTALRRVGAASRGWFGEIPSVRFPLERSTSRFLFPGPAAPSRVPCGSFVRWFARDNTRDVDPELTERYTPPGCSSQIAGTGDHLTLRHTNSHTQIVPGVYWRNLMCIQLSHMHASRALPAGSTMPTGP